MCMCMCMCSCSKRQWMGGVKRERERDRKEKEKKKREEKRWERKRVGVNHAHTHTQKQKHTNASGATVRFLGSRHKQTYGTHGHSRQEKKKSGHSDKKMGFPKIAATRNCSCTTTARRTAFWAFFDGVRALFDNFLSFSLSVCIPWKQKRPSLISTRMSSRREPLPPAS